MNKQSQKKIGWCDTTLNPVVGCTYGCEFCYAERMNRRFHYIEDFKKPQFFPERLEQLKSKKPRIIFMDSMSDIADWRPEWIEEVFEAIIQNPQHHYLFLTKRPECYRHVVSVVTHMCSKATYPTFEKVFKTVWFGVTITCPDEIERLSRMSAFLPNRFASIEPIQARFDSLKGVKLLDWVIVGPETGNREGKVVPPKWWIEELAWICAGDKVPIFMKESCVPIVGEENMLRQFPEGLRRRENAR